MPKKKKGKPSAKKAKKLPAPMKGVPRDDVGSTVQDFLDFDGVLELSVTNEDAAGKTFTVEPEA